MSLDLPPQQSRDRPAPRLQVADGDRARRAAQLFSMAVSLAMIGAVVWQVQLLDYAKVSDLVPRSPLFWLVFVVSYLASPLGDWIIFRRLWGLPFSAMSALIRKMVSNDLLLGYLGDAQFYSWARARLGMVTAPFGSIKDVAILSAMAGNAVTMVMLALAWPLVSSGQLGVATRDAYISLSIVLATSFLVILLRRQLFTLPKADLYFITGVHVVRITASLLSAALMWSLVLEDVPVSMWLVLATLRMLISRLPLLPNKDIFFAGITVFMLGREADISQLMALMTVLMLAAHIVMGSVFGLLGLFETEKMK